VHRDIRKAPERVCFVGQEVRRDEGIFIRPNNLPAERTVSPARLDPPEQLRPSSARRSLPASDRVPDGTGWRAGHVLGCRV
jgi:hypothetical protein